MADPGSPKEKENRVSSAALLPDNTPLEFRVILSACRVFLGTEEPAKLEALLQQGPESGAAARSIQQTRSDAALLPFYSAFQNFQNSY
jgi:hypothetical protein